MDRTAICGEERFCEKPIRLDDGRVGSELTRTLDGVESTLDDLVRTDIVSMEELDDGVEMSPLGGG